MTRNLLRVQRYDSPLRFTGSHLGRHEDRVTPCGAAMRDTAPQDKQASLYSSAFYPIQLVMAGFITGMNA
jgi:hypothetical protein